MRPAFHSWSRVKPTITYDHKSGTLLYPQWASSSKICCQLLRFVLSIDYVVIRDCVSWNVTVYTSSFATVHMHSYIIWCSGLVAYYVSVCISVLFSGLVTWIIVLVTLTTTKFWAWLKNRTTISWWITIKYVQVHSSFSLRSSTYKYTVHSLYDQVRSSTQFILFTSMKSRASNDCDDWQSNESMYWSDTVCRLIDIDSVFVLLVNTTDSFKARLLGLLGS